MTRVLIGAVIAIYVIGTWVFLQAVQDYPSHSAQVVFRWAVFYVVGAVIPLVWGIRTHRDLQRLGFADTRRVRAYVLGPMVLGWLITTVALGLIGGAG